MINIDNYQAYLLDKMEGRLSKEEAKELESFLKNNPELKPDFNAFDSAHILSPDPNIIYNNKAALLRKPFLYKRAIAYAASFLVFIFLAYALFFKPEQETIQPDLAQETSMQGPKPLEEMVITVQDAMEEPEEAPEVISEEISEYIRNDIEKEHDIRDEIEELIDEIEYAVEDIIEDEVEDQESNEINEIKIIYTNSLVVYEVDNLVIIQESAQEYYTSKLVELIPDEIKKTRNMAISITDRIEDRYQSLRNMISRN